MPKVTDEYRVARRDEIIDVAIRCFLRQGYARTSVADLVAESGLSAGAIYGNVFNYGTVSTTYHPSLLGGAGGSRLIFEASGQD